MHTDIYISIDINGYSTQPNIWGYDLFTFQIIDNQLLPMGDFRTSHNNKDTYCDLKSESGYNGVACTVQAKNDTEYFKHIVKLVKY